jgi:hypothetical protein
MNAPNNSSNALSAREANGLAEGNGTSADTGSEDDSLSFFCLMRALLNWIQRLLYLFSALVGRAVLYTSSFGQLRERSDAPYPRYVMRVYMLNTHTFRLYYARAADMFRARPESDEASGNLS